MRHSRGVADTLTAATSIWPTPMAGTPAQNGNAAAGNSDFSRKAEALAAALWTTPQAHDATMRGAGQVPTSKAGNACLARDATTWPTPAARDAKGENSPDHLLNGTGRLHMDQLPNAVAYGFSRPALMTPQAGKPSWHPRQTWRLLRLYVIATHGRATWRRLQASGGKRRLNPAFVGSLMGWPPGHSLCACSATEFSRWRQLMRGALSQLPTASGPWIWKPPAETPQPVQLNLI